MPYDLEAWETELLAGLELRDGKWVSDATTRRIIYLVNHRLEKIASRPEHWSHLYRDPTDGRYWELDHPHPEMHGGGPSRLRVIDAPDARALYGL